MTKGFHSLKLSLQSNAHKLKRTIPLYLTFVFLILSCSDTKEKQLGQSSVALFHKQFNSDRFSDIYDEASEPFRHVAPREEFVAYLTDAKHKLGVVRKTSPKNWRVDKLVTGTFVSLQYETEFSDGKAVEKFVFLINKDGAALYRYNVHFDDIK